MTTRKIPALTIVVCDRCGRERGEHGEFFHRSVKLDLNSAGLDYQGMAVGPGEHIQADFCDTCADLVFAAVRKLVLERP